MEKLAKAIVKFRWFIIVAVLALTGFLGYQIKDIKINSDVISSLPDEDPDALLIKKVGENFGGNRIGMVILETDNIFKTEVLEHVKMITDTISMMEGISSVTSLTADDRSMKLTWSGSTRVRKFRERNRASMSSRVSNHASTTASNRGSGVSAASSG